MSDYSSMAEVMPYCRMYLNGEVTFNGDTVPTDVEVEAVIGRMCGVLNMALQREGVAIPITNTTAKLTCDDWVTRFSVNKIKRMSPGVGYSDENQDTMGSYKGLIDSAMQFAKDNQLAFIDLGISQTHKASDGLAFTGQDVQSDRSDRDDSSLEQPIFECGLFNNKNLTVNDETDS